MKRSVTIRFSHIDGADIVFYPRYFELLSELFTDVPFDSAPFAMRTDFHKPNYLGDELEVEFASDAKDWAFTGRMRDRDHFSIRSLPADNASIGPAAHRPDVPAFQSSPIDIARWNTDCSGQLQVSRFFELVNLAVEQWFARSLGISFRDLHSNGGKGIPTVTMRTQCRELPRMGESTTMWIRPTGIGGKSLTYTSWLVRDESCLLQNEQTIVFVERRGGKFHPTRIPAPIRGHLERQYVAT